MSLPRWRRCGAICVMFVSWRKPLIRTFSGSDDGEVPASSPPWGHHLWGCTSAGGTSVWLGGWAQVSVCFSCGDQGGAVCHLQDRRRRVLAARCSEVSTLDTVCWALHRRLTLSGFVVASATEGSGRISALFSPEDGTAEEAGAGFFSVRMRHTLMV